MEVRPIRAGSRRWAGPADDPVIVAASHLQEALSRWGGDLGWQPLLAALVAVCAVGLGWQVARARGRRRRGPDTDAWSS
ncbi:hypothetical protein [Nocardia otitidiscaviarum]|uniref:hypothetical protein n=1 Tax=Nocardia otitidiscaviarum TaxID=1823 RepID=UPI00245495F8|nr:hypothetical protein [Nocardia otitidiscaviarum]